MSKKLSKPERRLKAVRRLEDVKIILENPCPVQWAEMKGDDRARGCSHCQLTVYNFLGLSQTEILNLINLHEGKLCAQIYVRSDGTVTLESCGAKAEHLELERGGLIVTSREQQGEQAAIGQINTMRTLRTAIARLSSELH